MFYKMLEILKCFCVCDSVIVFVIKYFYLIKFTIKKYFDNIYNVESLHEYLPSSIVKHIFSNSIGE